MFGGHRKGRGNVAYFPSSRLQALDQAHDPLDMDRIFVLLRFYDCQTVELLDFQTVGLSDCWTVRLSDYQTVILSVCQTFRICQTGRLIDQQTFKVSICHIV